MGGLVVLPYDGLLKRGRVVRDRAVSVEPDGVRTMGGEWIPADYVVVATGTSYSFPARCTTRTPKRCSPL